MEYLVALLTIETFAIIFALIKIRSLKSDIREQVVKYEEKKKELLVVRSKLASASSGNSWDSVVSRGSKSPKSTDLTLGASLYSSSGFDTISESISSTRDGGGSSSSSNSSPSSDSYSGGGGGFSGSGSGGDY